MIVAVLPRVENRAAGQPAALEQSQARSRLREELGQELPEITQRIDEGIIRIVIDDVVFGEGFARGQRRGDQREIDTVFDLALKHDASSDDSETMTGAGLSGEPAVAVSPPRPEATGLAFPSREAPVRRR